MSKQTFRDKARLAFAEVRMVASTALGLFAGRKVWMPKEATPETRWIDQCPKRNLDLARSSYDERLKSESAGIEAVRRRAEFALTAIIAAIGLSTAAFERLWAVATSSTSLLVIWSLGVLIVVVAVLVFAGVAVSNKVLGVVQVEEFVHLHDARREELRQYVLAVHTTSRTRRAMVTVFRDGFLIALVGLTLLAIAHTVSWAVPLDDAPAPVNVNIISPSPTP
ncbi:hypothetical protein GCM10010401_13790 [Rarobacter faecitabidus]|uniref:Uncharacterized protein n=1 Tax=Rarobacter faecitabidus TaxID=13243 RepID=A0A542ZE01_RARFA|nr:hypothetical protein [Rarobacter faecitabidus]TQL58574.1 hypothetical protein FB461_1989 [Rarobacter faecitabidus]